MQIQAVEQDTGSQVDPIADAFEKDYEEAVNFGAQYIYLGDIGKWKIGYKALEICEKWKRDKQKTIIKYASDIRMAHPRNIYEIVSTCEVFPEAIQEHIYETMKLITWSHCRAAARHAERLGEKENRRVDLEEIMDWLESANTSGINVEDFTASLSSGVIDTWMTKRKRIPSTETRCYVRDPDDPKKRVGIVELHVDWSVIQTINDLMKTTENQKDCIEYLMLKWLEKRPDKKTK